jgi:hypothetical protein
MPWDDGIFSDYGDALVSFGIMGWQYAWLPTLEISLSLFVKC